MNRLIREKRYQLLGLLAGTLVVLCALWYAVVRPVQASLEAKRAELPRLAEKIKAAKRKAQLGEKMEHDLERARMRLEVHEGKMAQGDIYNWMINKLQSFQGKHQIEFADFEPPQISDPAPRSKLPYKSAGFSVTGTGTYHEFGKFLADFENTFPHSRLRKLELEPSSLAIDTEHEDRALQFRMEFTIPVKPNQSQ